MSNIALKIRCPNCRNIILASIDWAGRYAIYYAHCRRCGKYIIRHDCDIDLDDDWEEVEE
jgi:hypothetical protein